MTRTADLTKGSIPGHFRRMAIPTAIGMVFTTLYNVVDSYFAGIISTDALAGIAISFHVFFILVTFGFGVNSAMGALVGNALGAGRRRHARTIACQGISYAVIASVLLTAIGYAVSPFLIGAVSEPGPFRDLANAYIDVLLLAAPAFIVVFSVNGILGAQGDAVSMQRAQIAAFFANVVLNPLMIFGGTRHLPGVGFQRHRPFDGNLPDRGSRLHAVATLPFRAHGPAAMGLLPAAASAFPGNHRSGPARKFGG